MVYVDFPYIYNMHVHLREGEITDQILPHEMEPYVAGLLYMPNLRRPIENAPDLVSYHQFLRRKIGFRPISLISSIKLTRNTTPKIIQTAHRAGARVIKFYPEGTTTNARGGFATLKEVDPDIFKAIEDNEMIFSQHPEMPGFAPLEAERAYYLEEAPWLLEKFPNLQMVFEHISTAEGVKFVKYAPDNIAGTITAHHAVLTAEDVFENDQKTIKDPYKYCKPPAHSFSDQAALIRAVFNCDRIFFGTDSAVHPPYDKELPNPKPGIWVPIKIAMAIWLEIFAKHAELDKFADFTSRRAARFYNLPIPTQTVRFVRKPWIVPKTINGLTPFMAGQNLFWQKAG